MPTTTAPSFVNGFDVSKWQGKRVDFAEAADAGRKFVFIKATEGVGYVDPQFERNWTAAKEAGLLRGAYHFARVSRSPTIRRDALAEAEWFAETVGEIGPGDLSPVLDIEWDKRAKGVKAKEILVWCEAFLERLEGLTDRAPIIYTGASYWRYKLLKSRKFDRYPLWLVQYTTKPLPPKPIELKDDEGDVVWTWEPTFWQWSHTRPVPGVGKAVDENRFLGTVEDLRLMAGYSPPTPVEDPEPEPDPDPGESIRTPIPVLDLDLEPEIPEKTREGWVDLLVALWKELFANRKADLISAPEPPTTGLDAAGGDA